MSSLQVMLASSGIYSQFADKYFMLFPDFLNEPDAAIVHAIIVRGLDRTCDTRWDCMGVGVSNFSLMQNGLQLRLSVQGGQVRFRDGRAPDVDLVFLDDGHRFLELAMCGLFCQRVCMSLPSGHMWRFQFRALSTAR